MTDLDQPDLGRRSTTRRGFLGLLAGTATTVVVSGCSRRSRRLVPRGPGRGRPPRSETAEPEDEA